MKKFHEQFNAQADKVHLSASERRDLRERVVSYMEYHPLPTQTTAARTKVSSVSEERPWRLQLPQVPYWRSLMGSALAVVILVVPVLAERSLPGDVLYAVKVGFNEEVRSSMARSPYQSIEWETERLNRRLSEVQILAREGRLTERHEERVAEAVRDHSEAARASIERLRAEDEDEAAMAEIALDALFDVHTAVLTAHGTTDEDVAIAALETTSGTDTPTAERHSRILAALESSRSDTSVTRDPARPTYEGLLRRIEVESGRAYELLSTVADIASDDALTSVTRRLDDVERKVQSAVAAHELGDVLEARVSLTEALTSTRKVITFMSNIEVRNSVDINTIVPIEHTAEELREQLHFKRERLQVRFAYVSEVVGEYADGAELERAEHSLERLPAQFASSTAAIETEDFAEAGALLADIEAVLDDIVRMADIPDRLPSSEIGTSTQPAEVPAATSSPATATSTVESETTNATGTTEVGATTTATTSATTSRSTAETATSAAQQSE